MKKALVLLVMLVVGTFMSGCATPVESFSDRMARYDQINNVQTKMIADDWDYLWLYEHNTRLSQWHPYIGY